MRMTSLRLLADIGGTNIRLAWQDQPDGPLHDTRVLPCAQFPTVDAAIAAYLAEVNIATPREAAFGIANPVTGDEVRMTNHSWCFSQSALKASLGLQRLVVINDFTALALALPALSPDEVVQVGGGAPVPNAPLGLVGPGTGLGVSGLLPAMAGHGAIPINGEGGHATLAATDDREEAVLRAMRQRFGHVSAERAVSGLGLVNLYDAVCAVDGVAARPLEAADITARALSGEDAQCVATLDLFCGFLGNVAGNVALTLGAHGGVYIDGNIMPRLKTAFARSRFRRCFEDKGRFRPFLEAIPTYVVNAKAPALLGAARALEELPDPN